MCSQIQITGSDVETGSAAYIGIRRLRMDQELATATRGRVQLVINKYELNTVGVLPVKWEAVATVYVNGISSCRWSWKESVYMVIVSCFLLVKFDVLTIVNVKSTFFWDVTLCSSVSQHFFSPVPLN
jgi:hypothetical protein